MPAVGAAQQAGELRRDLDTFELAATITNGLLLRVLTRPEESPGDSAELIYEVTVEGARHRPASGE